MPTTTERQDLRAYGYALLESFRLADPTRIAQVFPKRPSHLNLPKPVAFMDILAESATHSNGIRYRRMSPSFVFVFDPTLEVDAIDEVVDAFADFLSANPNVVPNTIWDEWTVTEESEEVESAEAVRILPSVRFTLPNFETGRGRA